MGADEEARVGWTTAQGQRSSFLHVAISTSGNCRIIWIDFQTALKPLYAALATQGDLAEGTETAQEDGVAGAWVRKKKLANLKGRVRTKYIQVLLAAGLSLKQTRFAFWSGMID